MSEKQNAIFFLLLTLMIVHGIVSGQFAVLWDAMFVHNKTQSGWNPFTGILKAPPINPVLGF